ncbi:flavodoxin [uncultured Sphaerochaeta sp.]|uniref:flavodoxin family protein n=1 Tax=uncultured Sphaerochaeta sp. TaxID=886478 RepID=UPI002A0A985E|nr:flavodoxin [uncultured Sphaerochaeta sp.]
MSIAIVYYSMEGHTDFIARKIGEQTGAVPIRLFPKKKFPKEGFQKYFFCGKSSVFHERPILENEDIDLKNYDCLVVGTPTWAGLMTAPVRSFLSQENFKGKQVYLFSCNSGGDGEKCLADMGTYLQDNTLKGWISFKQPTAQTYEEIEKTLTVFCKAIQEGRQYP